MKEYQDALKFWNDIFAPSDDNENEEEGQSASSLGCAVMENELRQLAKAGRILDLGCGSGWASVFLADAGAKVVGVDQSDNAVSFCQKEAEKYELSSATQFIRADEDWLRKAPDGEYDGFFSCNLFDVIPIEIAKDMLKEAARVVKRGAPVVISLNPYTDEAKKERLKLKEVAPKHFVMDGVLRIVNFTTDEWRAILEKHFDFVELKEFKFDHEPDTYIRRMFILKNK